MIGIIADDLTGANDIGAMLAKHNYLVYVHRFGESDIGLDMLPDALILDTNSRADASRIAYDKVRRAARFLGRFDCQLLIKKICSAFRGNIGAELDALLDERQAESAIVVAAYPKYGRITKKGLHYIGGRLLSESEFAHDPLHPMRESDLVKILSLQTKRRVGLIDHEVIAQGAAAIREKLAKLRRDYSYIIFDVIDQDSLSRIAEACAQEPIISSSSAIAEELPKYWPRKEAKDPLAGLDLEPDATGVLVLSGSTMPQTRAQLGELKRAGIRWVCLDARRIIAEGADSNVLKDIAEMAASAIASGRDFLIHTPVDPNQIIETATGKAVGLGRVETGRALLRALAEIAHNVSRQVCLTKLVIAGGETSDAICQRLGISGVRILAEVATGIPSSVALGGRKMLMVMKAGSFGEPDFFLKAIEHLKRGVKG